MSEATGGSGRSSRAPEPPLGDPGGGIPLDPVLRSERPRAAVGGIQGAIISVPLVAAIEVVLERMQARDEPVAQDPSGGAHPDEEERAAQRVTLADNVRRAIGR